MENQKVEMINGLLKEAEENYIGVWDISHTSRMNQIFNYIEELRKETGIMYSIDGTRLVPHEV